MNEYLKILILGLVEGITEFLPVSSTGHLILANSFLNLKMNHVETFEIAIQLGAILAVVVLYFGTFVRLFRGTAPFKLGMVMVTCLPACGVGFLAHTIIKEHLFNRGVVLTTLAVGGLALIGIDLVVKTYRKEGLELPQMTYQNALLIGIFQCLSLVPGVSRAAATISGGVLMGFKYRAAAEYSFVAAVPIMIIATGYDLLKTGSDFSATDWEYLAFGLAISFISALFVMKALIATIGRIRLAPFGIYRIVLAIAFYFVFQ